MTNVFFLQSESRVLGQSLAIFIFHIFFFKLLTVCFHIGIYVVLTFERSLLFQNLDEDKGSFMREEKNINLL